MAKLESYDKKLPYSYALGVFPALNLLAHRPNKAMRLLLNPQGYENQGVAKLREKCRQLGVREEEAERVLRRRRCAAVPRQAPWRDVQHGGKGRSACPRRL